MGKHESIALLIALYLPVISASAQVTKWQDYVPGYTLEATREFGGVVNVITDVIQSQPEGGAGDDEKSINNYSLRRVHLAADGVMLSKLK